MNEELRIEKEEGATRWSRVRRIFEAVVELPAEERAAFLDSRCDDDAVRREVEELLRHESDAGESFLRPPPTELGVSRLSSADDAPDPLIGQTVGAFTIRETIARGGMGTVYLAEQAHPKREVAVKVLHAGLWSRSAEKRFEFESQVLARLRHPNIAQVYEAGTHRLETGTTAHYFAMEYIPNARTLTKYATEHSLDFRASLELFLQACDAVNHGHQKAVIHRDLKPENIVVDAEGRVKVIDFGVASCTDSDVNLTTMHTDVGQLIGTLAYMSPEQCEGDPGAIDTRSDVYSLGVLLYELLCGKPPYDVGSKSIPKITRIICEGTPVRPSSIDRQLRGDLEMIVLKCLEKDRAKRYQSAADLGADIRRYLNGEPIYARPPTTYSRALRWAAKHPTKATTISCLSVVALIALATMASLYFLGQRPDHIEMVRDRSEVRLLTVGGRVLHRWVAGTAAPIHFAELVRQPEQLGGRRLAVISFMDQSKINAGQLCAFDVDGNWSRPVWQKSIERDDLTSKVEAMGPKDWGFSPRYAIVADIFPEPQSPGPEVAVMFTHQRSHRALCIYDTNGTLLYRIWQDGGIGSLYWLAKPGLLVCAGFEESVKDNLGKYGLTQGPVLFALKPNFGFKSKEYMRKTPGDDPLSPIWYRYFYPPQSVDLQCVPELTSEVGLLDRDQFVRLAIDLKVQSSGTDWDEVGGVSMIVDDHGQEMSNSKSATDAYNANRDRLPKLDVFKLRDDPPTQNDIWKPPTSSPSHP